MGMLSGARALAIGIVVVATALSAAAPAFANEFIVRVRVAEKDGKEREFSGVVVAPERIVTSAVALGAGAEPAQVTVFNSAGASAVANALLPQGDLILISAPLTARPAMLAAFPPMVNDPAKVLFHTNNGVTTRAGTFTRTDLAELQGDPLLTGRSFGGALLNACGEVTAIVAPHQMTPTAVFNAVAVNRLLAVTWIGVDRARVSTLTANAGIAARLASDRCVPPPPEAVAADAAQPSEQSGAAPEPRALDPVAEADRKAAEAQSALEKKEAELRRERARPGLSAEEKARLAEQERELEELRATADAAQKNADTMKAEKEQSDAQRERVQFWGLIGGIAAGVILVLGGVIAYLLLSKANKTSNSLRQDKEQLAEAERRRASAPDWVLTGPGGRLKLRGMLLADESRGAVVGRGQTDADVLVDLERISRRHARFFLRGEQMFVEDLRSLNGTSVNGRRLAAGEVAEVRPGDRIEFADQAYTLTRA